MTWLAFLLALTCADGSCDSEDWAPLPPAADAVDADECPYGAPGCDDFDVAPVDPYGPEGCGVW